MHRRDEWFHLDSRLGRWIPDGGESIPRGIFRYALSHEPHAPCGPWASPCAICTLPPRLSTKRRICFDPCGATRTAGRLPVSAIAVDEAHCISEWGHDFRPHYREIGLHRRSLGTPPTIALTATATLATRADIIQVLGLRLPVIALTSFDRPNLHFSV